MNIFTQLVMIIGRRKQDKVEMLGTGFIVSNEGHIVSTQHVVGVEDANLVILAPQIANINAFQDLSVTTCRTAQAQISETDPIRDLVVLKVDMTFNGQIPKLGSFDNDSVGDEIGIFGFPHCVEGRRVLTFQKAEIGAKILLESSSVKSKYAVINIQARPGQSGSMIFSQRSKNISGVLIGAWAPSVSGISLGGINPRELHQTTHCISAEYIKEML